MGKTEIILKQRTNVKKASVFTLINRLQRKLKAGDFILNRYERARIIGARALQIAMDAPLLIDTDETDSIKIAILELNAGILPLTVIRPDE
ncbi:MAG: DNA-directed RNA polymerase subunit K [Candidatus Methanofastidiosia archaeon]